MPKQSTTRSLEEAADTARDTLRSLLPPDGQSPGAASLRRQVADGGLHFEAKLARWGEETVLPSPNRGPAAGDLKGDLLRLLQAARDFGTAVDFPAARAALEAIEGQQAANVLARENGTAYLLQFPFHDGGEWRTLHLAFEPEAADDAAGGTGRGFRLLLHVPLTDLGDTWIDAALVADRFRAVLYLDRAGARDRVRGELPALAADLAGEGFGEVLLDVRPAGALPAVRRRQGAELRVGRPEWVNVVDVRA